MREGAPERRETSRARRLLAWIEAALTATALAEEGESDAAKAIAAERSGRARRRTVRRWRWPRRPGGAPAPPHPRALR